MNSSISGSVSSRFVSQTELSEAQKRKEEEVRAKYERLGQTPPPEELARARNEVSGEGEVYDPRSLYERLKANKDAKQEAIDEKLKLANQFRGIDDGESVFLAQVAKEKLEAERQKEKETKEELEKFRKAALAKEASPPKLPSSIIAASSNPMPTKSKNKRKRQGILGVVKKKAKEEDENKDGEAPRGKT